MKSFDSIERRESIKKIIIYGILIGLLVLLAFGGSYLANKKKEAKKENNSSKITDNLSSSEEISNDETSQKDSIKEAKKLDDLKPYLKDVTDVYDLDKIIQNEFLLNKSTITKQKSNYLIDKNSKLFLNSQNKLEYKIVNNEDDLYFEQITEWILEYNQLEDKIVSFEVLWSIDEPVLENLLVASEKSIYIIDTNGKAKSIYNFTDDKKIIGVYRVFGTSYDCIPGYNLAILCDNGVHYIFNKYISNITPNGVLNLIPLKEHYKENSIIYRTHSCCYDECDDDKYTYRGINIDKNIFINSKNEIFKDPVTNELLIVDKIFRNYNDWLVVTEDNKLYLFYKLGYTGFGTLDNLNYDVDEEGNITFMEIKLVNGQQYTYIQEDVN